MAMLSAIGGILSAVVGAVGAVVAGQQQAAALEQQAENERAAARAAEYRQQVIKMNQGIAEKNAARVAEVAQIQQMDQDTQTQAMIGEQIAAQAASGLSLGGRTQMLTRKSAAILGRKDALNIRYAGEMERYNILTEAANLGSEAELTGMEAGSYRRSAEATQSRAGGAMLAGFINAAGSLLGAASSFRGFGGTSSTTRTGTPYSRPMGLAV